MPGPKRRRRDVPVSEEEEEEEEEESPTAEEPTPSRNFVPILVFPFFKPSHS